MTQEQMQQRWLPVVTTTKIPVIQRILFVRDDVARCELEDGRQVDRAVVTLEMYYRPEPVAA